MGYIFVSYPRVCEPEVAELQKQLEACGIEVWRDTEQLRYGTHWDARVTAAIRAASAVVLFQAPAWFSSRPCHIEEEQARYYHRPLIEVPFDADADDLAKIAETIARRFAMRSEDDDLVADLETRAAAWIDGGSRTRLLARGRDLKRFRRLIGRRADGTTDVARTFVSRSTGHARFVRTIAVIMVAAIGLSGITVVAGNVQIKSVEKQKMEWREMSTVMSAVRLTAPEEPFAAAALALDACEDSDEESWYTDLVLYHRALEVETPVSYGESAPANIAFSEGARTSLETASGVRIALDEASTGLLLYDATGEVAARVVLDAPVLAIASDPTGACVAAATKKNIKLIDTARGQVFRTLAGVVPEAGCALAWSDAGDELALKMPAGTYAVWKTAASTRTAASTDCWFMDGCVLADGLRWAVLSRDGRIALIDRASGELLEIVHPLATDQASAIAAGANADTVYVIAFNELGENALWKLDLATGAADEVPLPDGFAPREVASSTTVSDRVAVGSSDRVLVLDAQTGDVMQDITGSSVSTLAMDEQGRVFIGAVGGGLSVVEPGTSELARVREAESDILGGAVGILPGAMPRAIACSGDMALAVGDGFNQGSSRTLTKRAGWWELNTGATGAFVAGDVGGQARAVAASPDGSVFAIGLSDGGMAFMRAEDVAMGTTVREQASEIRACTFTPQGTQVLAATRDGEILVIDVDLGGFDATTMRERVAERVNAGQSFGLFTDESVFW